MILQTWNIYIFHVTFHQFFHQNFTCPQLTVLNAGRKYLGLESLAGRVLVTSGLGGMSGAQAKAAVICGCIGVVAEVSMELGHGKTIIRTLLQYNL